MLLFITFTKLVDIFYFDDISSKEHGTDILKIVDFVKKKHTAFTIICSYVYVPLDI